MKAADGRYGRGNWQSGVRVGQAGRWWVGGRGGGGGRRDNGWPLRQVEMEELVQTTRQAISMRADRLS